MAKRKTSLSKSNNKISILTSQGGFSFLVHSDNEVLALQHKEYETNSPENQLENIEKLINEDLISQYQINEAHLTFDDPLFTNVPDQYFDQEQAPHYLKYNTELLPGDYIDIDNVSTLELEVVYIPIMNINNYFVDKIGNVSYNHQMSSLLNFIKPDNNFEENVFINRYFDNCYIIAFFKNKCHLANRFKVQTDEDLAYYLLSVIDQLKFDREKLKLLISGFITKECKAYHYFYDYVKNIDFYSCSIPSEHFLFNAFTYRETNLLCHYLSE